MKWVFSNPLEGDNVADILVDTWLYGEMALFGGEARQGSYAHLQMSLPERSTVNDLLACLNMPTQERGITFINGLLSAMPGLQPDLEHILCHNDRVAFFDHRGMWPFQYRHGAAAIPEMATAMQASSDHGLHHSYET